MNWCAAQVLCALQSRSVLALGAFVSYSVPVHCVTATHALPSLTVEYDVPTTHAAHWRSAVAEPALDWPWPTAHVVHTAQLSVASVVLVLALNEPPAHAAHCRSLLAVAATVVRKPGAHGALTAWHAAPLSTAENVEPATHAAHWRSLTASPSTDSPWPLGHVAQVAQLSVASVVLVVALNVPAAHAAHCRSLVAVAATIVRKPGPHGALTAVHSAALLTLEYVEPATHAVHWWSAVAEPCVERP